nr:potassium channel family protein [Gelidibacter pelagius]
MWVIITLTIVGYGSVHPITVGGRMFTFFYFEDRFGKCGRSYIVLSALTHSYDDPVDSLDKSEDK